MRLIGSRFLWSSVAVCALAIAAAGPAHARDQQVLDEFRSSHPELFPTADGRRAQPAAIPDIFGPGAVLNVGDVYLKVTNYATIGNPFTNISSDPSMQWPGASGIEYLAFSLISVGAVNPTATDPAAIRRVSYFSEWRPPTLEPEDRMYRAYDGIVNGGRFKNDDDDADLFTGKKLFNEDFLDGRDNDGDGRIDEDYAAIGDLMFSCVMRDDTPAAINSVFNEKHVPLGLEMKQVAWAYATHPFRRFNPVEFTVTNRSGHTLDSMYFALRTDMDCGPIQSSTYYSDDYDVPYFPAGRFLLPADLNRLQIYAPNPDLAEFDTLCARIPLQVSGTSVVDDDGDEGQTRGVSSIILLGHTLDPLGQNAPSVARFRALRSYIGGTPYQSGGNPTVDQQRYEFMASNDNIDPETGMVTLEQGEQVGDYQSWFSVGPFRNIPDGGSFQVTVAFMVSDQPGGNATLQEYRADLGRFEAGQLSGEVLMRKYPALSNAYAAQVAYIGKYDAPPPGLEDEVPNCFGCETVLQLPRGTPNQTVCAPPCGDDDALCKPVTEFGRTWFNFDCDFCTGAWNGSDKGFYLYRWNVSSPPPSPGANTSPAFNYSDNPDRGVTVTPAGDGSVTIAWDNLSEITPDPGDKPWFDFRSYRLWKVANWARPVGSAGPSDDDWALVGEFTLFDHAPNNLIRRVNPANPADTLTECPTVWIPQRAESMQVCLQFGDLWDRQSGEVIRPDPSVDCVRENGECVRDSGWALNPCGLEGRFITRTKYPVGRYRYVDREVKNGFLYFYALTAGDSMCVKWSESVQCSCEQTLETHGRVSAVESEGVVPQAGVKPAGGVWVVPNPYRGYSTISQRPSSWDLTPNASDPTGTHVDFMGLPRGTWKIRIYTVSGDLVAELHSDDPVNADLRPSVVGADGVSRPGYNRQQDNQNDGQARWNLISRNGQDVVSGIYVFVVESEQGQQRGRFVIIR